MSIKEEEVGLILILLSCLLIKIFKPCHANLTVGPTLVRDGKANGTSVPLYETKYSEYNMLQF